MKNLKQIPALLAGSLMVLNAFAAEDDAPGRPLHVLYLGPVPAESGGGAPGPGGNPRTNYVYLPGQTLAPEAIYFDYLADGSHLTEAYLKHVDAVVQVMPDAGLGADQAKWLDGFEKAGKGLIKYGDGNRPRDAELRKAVLESVGEAARSILEAHVASRPPLQRLPGEVPNY